MSLFSCFEQYIHATSRFFALLLFIFVKQEKRLEQLKDDVIRYLYKIDDPDKGGSILSDYDIEDLAIKIVENIDELVSIINGKAESL